MKRGLVLINAYTQSQTELNQPRRIAEELGKLGVETEIRRNDFFAASVGGRCEIDSRVSGYDFCVYLDKDKYMSQMLERAGLRLFNCSWAIEACDDKMQTFFALSGQNVAVPETLAGFLCYCPDQPVSAEALDKIERLGYPLVVKECYGSLGKGVYLAHDRRELESLAERLKCKPHLFQKFVAESAGRDLRVIVVGGSAVAAMRRVSNTDFRSNAELGGQGEPFELDGRARYLSEKVARLLRLDYCGIDLLFGKDGYLLCEVNSNAFFGKIEAVTGVNVAQSYARHIIKEIYGGE